MRQPAASAASSGQQQCVTERQGEEDEGVAAEQAEVRGISGHGVGLWRHPFAGRDGELMGLIMLQGIHSA